MQISGESYQMVMKKRSLEERILFLEILIEKYNVQRNDKRAAPILIYEAPYHFVATETKKKENSKSLILIRLIVRQCKM